MWISTAIALTVLVGFIYIFFFQILLKAIKIDKENRKENEIKKVHKRFISAIVIIWVIFGILEITGLRLDYSAGQHYIIPTAIDTDFWGNYKVYYKTTVYESNASESYYYVQRDRNDLIELIQNYIKDKKEIMVYYDKWVGFKGLSSPDTSPIIKVLED